MRRNHVEKMSWGQSMQNFVKGYSCESEEVPNQVPENVCLHYKVLSHLRQFLRPLYGQHPEVSLMLMSSYPTQCHYIPRVDESM